MSNPVIDKIQNPRIRELADQCVHRSQGDFGMVVEGGVDLELFAQRIVQECVWEMGRYEFIDVAIHEVKEHFGVK